MKDLFTFKPIHINKDTLVYFFSNWANEYSSLDDIQKSTKKIELFLSQLRLMYKQIYSFYIPWWYKAGLEFCSVVSKYCDNLTVLSNSIDDLHYYKKNKLNTIFCNQNCWLDNKIFNIIDIKKEYDLVLNASTASWKNHSLLKNINKKYKTIFITYTNKNTDKRLQLYSPSKILTNISVENIAEHLCKAKIGLALSKIEGSCYASTEYLLCGLPVVSVESKGGRDIWYTDKNSVITEAKESSLLISIDELISKLTMFNSTEIREECILLQNSFREKFNQYLQTLIPNEDIPFIMKKNYVNKMLYNIDLDNISLNTFKQIINHFNNL